MLSRPQYIYGPLTNKRDYLDWFFDRVVHGLEYIPLPLHGDQLVALTHAEDVAAMLASVVGNENAVNEVRARYRVVRTKSEDLRDAGRRCSRVIRGAGAWRGGDILLFVVADASILYPLRSL